jgi:hypothetical protein
VLDEAVEEKADGNKVQIGMVVSFSSPFSLVVLIDATNTDLEENIRR